ncbi:MAG: T9SS type A sorting domain-containing protein [Bacteroidota bacterium]
MLFASVHTFASQIAGAEISYKCTTTPGIFEVTLILYTSCDGSPSLCTGTCGAPCSKVINIYGVDSPYNQQHYGNVTMNLVNVRDMNAAGSCPGAKNTCTNMGCVSPGTYSPSFERYEFKGLANVGNTSTIPSACCNVRFVWETCCRGAGIYTIVSSDTSGFYIDAVINRCLPLSPCSSSPQFRNDPLMTICGGENFVFNNGADDPEGDSLTYRFVPALKAFKTPVGYIVPFNYDKPMPWTGAYNAEFPGGIRCDTLTGDVSFTPGNGGGQNFTGVVAVEVKQWRMINGTPTILGITRRDVQTVVLSNCTPNNPPRFITNPPHPINPNAPQLTWDVCGGEQLCFTITAKDTDFKLVPPIVSDTTSLTWDSSLASLGASFTLVAPTTAREKTYQFCWTPPDSLKRANPYYFTVSAKDNRCPNPGRVSRSFAIRVKEKVSLNIHKGYMNCGSFKPGYTNNKPAVPPSLVQWQISRYPWDFSMTNNPYQFNNVSTCPLLKFRETGKYLIILAATNGSTESLCTQFYYDTIEVHDTMIFANAVDFTINKDTQCFIGHSFVFNDTSSFIYTNRQWDLGDGTSDTGSMVSKTYAIAKPYTVTYSVTDTNNCMASMLKQVTLGVNKIPQSLCRVTVDSISHKNIILWKPVDATPTVSFRIYKEQGGGVSTFLGNCEVKSFNTFMDSSSTPDIKPERYVITTVDTCGNESSKSTSVQSLYLSVSHEFSNTWSLYWAAIQGGVDIYRGNSPGNLSLITSVQAGVSTYKDIEAPEEQTFYMVSTKPGSSCDSAGKYLSSQSNVVFAKKTGLSEVKLSQMLAVVPNPVTDILTIESRVGQSVSMKVFDAMGRAVFNTELHRTHSQLNVSHFSSGFYTIEFRSGDQVYYQKLIKR